MNEMSIFISKDSKRSKKKHMINKAFKLEDVFVDLIKDTKEAY